MQFLADESCDFAVVRALRENGHDALAVAEVAHRADDSEVLELARSEARILLTEDKDFGQLVYSEVQATSGVILIRFPAKARSKLPAMVVKLVAQRGEQLLGRFVVLRPGRIRFGRRPKA